MTTGQTFSFRRWLLRMALPVTKLMNRLHLSPSHRQVKAAHYRKALQVLQPGDVLLSWRWGELSNFFIPGTWSHAALYIGDEKVREAVYDGVIETDLIDFMLSKDKVLILRPSMPVKVIEEAIVTSADAIGLPYDFMFDEGEKSFYCSELIWFVYNHAYFSLTGNNLPLQKKKIMGVWTVTPEDLANSEKVFVRVSPIYGKEQ